MKDHLSNVPASVGILVRQLAAGFAVMLLAGSAMTAEIGEYELGGSKQPYDRIPATFVTRHVPWAKPLPGGSLKAFIVCPQSATREVVELAQRLDLDYTVVMTGDINYLTHRSTIEPYIDSYVGGSTWGGALINGERVIPRLFTERLDLAQAYDLIIVARVHWETLPAAARDNIVERVKKGAGLVMVCQSPHSIYREVPAGTPGAVPGRTKSYVLADRGIALPAGLTDLQSFGGDWLNQVLPMEQLPLLAAADQDQSQAILKTYDQQHPDAGRYGNRQFTRATYSLQSGTLGAGRIVVLTYFVDKGNLAPANAFIPALVYEFKRYDLLQAMFAKLCLYAADKAGEIRLKADPQNSRQIALEDLGKTTLRFLVEGERRNIAQMEWNYRDKDGEVIGKGILAAANLDASPVKVAIPKELNRPGLYTLDAWVRDDQGKILDFASSGFEVPLPAGVKILSVSTEKDRYAAEETVKGKIVLEGDLPQNGRARLKVRDSWQRLVYTTILPVTGKDVDFAFPVHAPLSTYWEITASIENSLFELTSQSCAIAIPDPRLTNFHLVDGGYYWGGIQRGGLDAAPEVRKRLHQAGFEAATVVYPQWAEYAARDGWRLQGIISHMTSSVHQQKDADGYWINSVCLNNPKVARETGFGDWQEAMGNNVKGFAKYGNTGAPIGFEAHIPKACACQYCREKFREAMRRKYATVERLNAQWNSDYRSFDDVVPLPPAQAFKLNRPCQWVDHQLWHTSEVHSGFYLRAIEYLRQFDPNLKPCLVDNAYTFTTHDFGLPIHDWPRISKQVTGSMVDDFSCRFVARYSDELVRGLGGDQGYLCFFGDTSYHANKADWAQRLLPWWSLFRGYSSVQAGFGLSGGPGWAGAGGGKVTADGSEPMPWFKGFLETTAEVRKGPATLMLESTFAREPVAIVLSTVNTLASLLDPLGDTSATEAIHDFQHALKVMGVTPYFIGDDDLNEKALAERGFKALILPYNRAMSESQAEALRTFVNRGGLLIADNDPGILDDVCKNRTESIVKELFPVTDRLNLQPLGKGCTLYLAGEFRGADVTIPKGERKGLREFQETLAKFADIRPPASLLNDKGIERYDSEAGSYLNHGARYLCLLRNHYAKEVDGDTTTVRMVEPRHIYDIRAKKYLGQASEFTLNIPKDEPKFIGLTPAKFMDMKLKLASRRIKAGDDLSFAVQFKFDRDIPFGHGIHVEVLNPAGEALLYYFKNYVFTGNELKITLPTAYDLALGKYVIKVNSIVADMKQEAVCDVRQ